MADNISLELLSQQLKQIRNEQVRQRTLLKRVLAENIPIRQALGSLEEDVAIIKEHLWPEELPPL